MAREVSYRDPGLELVCSVTGSAKESGKRRENPATHRRPGGGSRAGLGGKEVAAHTEVRTEEPDRRPLQPDSPPAPPGFHVRIKGNPKEPLQLRQEVNGP